ncbi:MAG TPA: peptidoglycan-associated lipoprotein Pal [Nitrospirae bacterium]|nr:outer membrane lipoprotein Omp16 precursor [bacterium BMS3Abin07]GBE32367.1 outer membrane lipoprotein Omp16 precursor [bacterium BMS3Bbin05]HDH00497.1 peptidoglycan-associated lipoprotein Pal [Nitrospirota bacterium]HDL20559.1 peptidoglycan-associated lipoprotein Pal [Nitrospirota bacterium]HDO21360.1 peptidoglycan-associated lipoprotein Pal [Nitrospirota bacterium]
MKKVLLLFLVFAFLFSCAERKVTSTKETVQPEQEQTKKEKMTLPEQKEGIAPVRQENVQESAREVGVKSLEEVLKNDIHFDFDRYDIKTEDKATLKEIADWLIQNSGVSIRIEGNCDERGTNEYNLGLGDRRANSAKSYLMTLGVSSSRIQTISYGEERPLCTESNETCWARNRRDHFTAAE